MLVFAAHELDRCRGTHFYGISSSVGDDANTHQPTVGASLYVASASKKMAAKLFILRGDAEAHSSTPVGAEPSQLLVGMWPFAPDGDDSHIPNNPVFGS